MKAPPRPLLVPALVIASGFAFAGPVSAAKKFTSAELTKIVNEVKLLLGDQTSTEASLGTVVRGNTAVQTGNRSRSELMFPDESVVRLGSNSVFSFAEGDRDLNLDQGTMLLQAPKFHGKTQITTAAVTAAITGTTIMMEYVPPVFDKNGKLKKAGTVKLIVIEGKLEFALTANPRKKMRLGPGEMAVVRTTDTELPAAPLIVDLKRLEATSQLLDGGMGPLPDVVRIQQEIASQTVAKEKAQLIAVGSVKLAKSGPGLSNNQAVHHSRLFVNAAPPAPPMLVSAPTPPPPPRNDPPRPIVIVTPPPPNCTDISGPIPPECMEVIQTANFGPNAPR